MLLGARCWVKAPTSTKDRAPSNQDRAPQTLHLATYNLCN